MRLLNLNILQTILSVHLFFSERIVKFVFYSKIGLRQLDGRRERPLGDITFNNKVDTQNPSVDIVATSSANAVNLRFVFVLHQISRFFGFTFLLIL